MNSYMLLFIFGIILANYSQILLKKATLQQYDSRIKEYVNPYVIIGYSFPFFNREYDNFLLADTIFDNIYIQCPDKSFADISSVVDSFIQHRKPIQPINADDTSPFFIPRNL